MRLIKRLIQETKSNSSCFSLFRCEAEGLCFSLNRFEIPLAQIGQLSIACHEYFEVDSLLLPSSACKSYRVSGHWVTLSLLIVIKCLKSMARDWGW